jgi:hypothetical protein
MTDKTPKQDETAENTVDSQAKDNPESGKWSTGAKVGAAVGSAALLGALLYAGRYAMKTKVEPQSPSGGEPKPPVPPSGEQFESD